MLAALTQREVGERRSDRCWYQSFQTNAIAGMARAVYADIILNGIASNGPLDTYGNT
jgi:hypothetical protein